MIEITEALDKAGIAYKINPNKPSELQIRCFSGLHDDKNPSLSFNLDKGLFNCFSCGFKGNSTQFWSELGIHIKPSFSSKTDFKISQLRQKLSKLSSIEVRLPESTTPVAAPFKEVSVTTLKKFGAFTVSSGEFEDYLCIPVYQHKKLRFIEGRYKHLDPGDKPKYLRKPDGASIESIMFPLDAIEEFKTIILVEGLFDALNLWDLGYHNALCIFGTQAFTPAKARILDEYGVQQVKILMDGDSAGIAASKRIQTMLNQRNISSTVIELPNGIDPGDLDVEAAEHFLSDF
jgi:DNA primase